jgi:hypothetical protein
MIILKPIATPQIIKFIPTRDGNADTLVLVNETTNENNEITVSYQICCVECAYYQQVTTVLDLEEGHFYSVTFLEGDKLVHRDKIFCTSQDVDSYTVNKDEYVVNKENIIFYE